MACRLSLVHRDTPSLSTPTLASGCVSIDHVKGSLTPEHLLHHHSHDQSEEGARGLKGSDGIGIPGGNLGIGLGITFIKCGRLGSASKDDSNGLLVGNLAAKTEGIGLETGGLGAVGALTGTVTCLAGTVSGAAGATGTLRVGCVPGGATGGVFNWRLTWWSSRYCNRPWCQWPCRSRSPSARRGWCGWCGWCGWWHLRQ